MAAIDKAAIGWSIAIVAAGVAFAFMGSGMQDHGTSTMAPTTQTTTPTPAPTPATTQPTKDPFADIVKKVKDNAASGTTTEVKVKDNMKMTETAPTPAPAPAPTPAASAATSADVKIPTGTSTPGCDDTKSCFNPDSVTIAKGGKVTWTNTDTAAHTVTSGSPTDGPSGVFDSSLIMSGNSFEFTFDESGTYTYFCMVHPWMTGSVTVN